MAFTQAQLTALEEAYATGAIEVRYGDRTVRYESREAMRAILDEMRAELGVAKSGMKIVPVAYSKGTRGGCGPGGTSRGGFSR